MPRAQTYLAMTCACAVLLGCGDDDSGNAAGNADGGKTNVGAQHPMNPNGKPDAGTPLSMDAGNESDCIDIGERFEATYCVGDYCLDDPKDRWTSRWQSPAAERTTFGSCRRTACCYTAVVAVGRAFRTRST